MIHRKHERIAVGDEHLLDVGAVHAPATSRSSRVSARSRTRNVLSRYMSQYVQWFHEQPIVAWRM